MEIIIGVCGIDGAADRTKGGDTGGDWVRFGVAGVAGASDGGVREYSADTVYI